MCAIKNHSALVLVLLLHALCPAPVTKAQAPVSAVPKGTQIENLHLHDPWILADRPSHTYYLYSGLGSKNPADARASVVSYISKDLNSWTGPFVVFQVPADSWADPKARVWAPEVHCYRGKYYLFTTLHNYDRPIPRRSATTTGTGTQIDITYNGRGQHLRGTQVFVSASPLGPFTVIDKDAPIPPLAYMTLDGTLYVEDNVPYMIYAHEWLQVIDGTMEAVQMKPDLSAAAGEPLYLFKGSDAPWLQERRDTSNVPASYVTDGPELYRTSKGRLLMIWSSYRDGKYVETLAYSESGKLAGPWRQGPLLLDDDSGHGMFVEMFDGRTMLVVHHPMDARLSKGMLYEVEDTGDSVRLKTHIE